MAIPVLPPRAKNQASGRSQESSYEKSESFLWSKEMRETVRKVGATLGVLLLASVWLFGQAETGTISGTITDNSGAVVPGATVTVMSVNTGLSRSTTAGSAGEYAVPSLKPDTYSITVEHEGFQKYTRKVVVDVGSRVDLSAQLSVSGASTTVEVTASGETAAVNTETQSLSQVVTAQDIANLPTLTRNPYDLVATSGNVTEDQQSGRGAGVAINGQRSSNTDILLDGGENVDLFTAAVGQSVPLDSVQEFRVVTSDFTAEYGRAGGGVVMLRIIETEDQNQQWLGVADIMRAEALEDANAALDRASGRVNGIAAITPERVIREGDSTEQMIDVIEKDVDISMLVLAASPGPEGPGPIISAMANAVGSFPIPVIIVPGDLSDAEIDALS